MGGLGSDLIHIQAYLFGVYTTSEYRCCLSAVPSIPSFDKSFEDCFTPDGRSRMSCDCFGGNAFVNCFGG